MGKRNLPAKQVVIVPLIRIPSHHSGKRCPAKIKLKVYKSYRLLVFLFEGNCACSTGVHVFNFCKPLSVSAW